MSKIEYKTKVDDAWIKELRDIVSDTDCHLNKEELQKWVLRVLDNYEASEGLCKRLEERIQKLETPVDTPAYNGMHIVRDSS